MAAETGYIWGTGRRKAAVARVRLRRGTGHIIVNRRGLDEYFTEEKDRLAVMTPFKTTKTTSKFDCFVNVTGGGFTGQAGAIVLGVARALKKFDESLTGILHSTGLLTRDGRMKERKKYGRKGARKSFQYSKR
jgi:small subunit ribosomal protein S9